MPAPAAAKTVGGFLFMGLLALVSMLRGQPGACGFSNIWWRHNWLTDYEHGFVRRGLAGTLAKPFLSDPAATTDFIAAATIAVNMLAVAGVAVLLLIVWRGRDRALFAAFAIFVATTPMLPYLMPYDGALDGFILALCTAATLALMRGHAWVFAALFAIGALVHEEAVVVLLPLAGCAALLGTRGGKKAAFGACAVAAFVFVAGILNPATMDMAEKYVLYGMPPSLAQDIVAYLNLPLADNVRETLTLWRNFPAGSLIAALYPLFAVVPLLALGAWRLRAPGAGWKMWLGGGVLVILPYGALALALDTSRLAAFATFSNALLAVYALTRLAAPAAAAAPPAPVRIALAAPAFVLYCAAPVMLLWPFGLCQVNIAYHQKMHAPLADAARALQAHIGRQAGELPPAPPRPASADPHDRDTLKRMSHGLRACLSVEGCAAAAPP
ncbi:MAG: hypothetical protein GC131_08680 [Alphaproteobacteria bacterium]|nr:hypothetical protein [Alphaproteobacteria bacterium]